MASPKSTLKLRGKTYYLHYTEKGKRCRISLGADSLRIAEEKQRQFDSARARGGTIPCPPGRLCPPWCRPMCRTCSPAAPGTA